MSGSRRGRSLTALATSAVVVATVFVPALPAGAADGARHVFPRGAAPDHGGPAETATPVVGLAATSSGGGYWVVTADGAVQAFGDALPFKSYDAELNGNQARVTYTYTVASINQEQEPWVLEDGAWREDDC